MTDPHERVFGMMIDLTSKVGDMDARISMALGTHTAQLNDVVTKLAYANGKTADTISRVNAIEVKLSDYNEIREGTKDVVTTKKAIVMLIGTIMAFGGILWAMTRYVLKSYINETVSMSITQELSSQVKDVTIEK